MNLNLKSIYGRFTSAASALQPFFLLAVRLYWGWQFTQTGYGKLTHIAKPIEYFQSLGIPFPTINAYMASCTELIGGSLLIIGLLSRLAAVPLICVMMVAYLTAEHDALVQFISDSTQFETALPCTFLIASLIILIFGSGKFSLDYLLFRHPEEKHSPSDF